MVFHYDAPDFQYGDYVGVMRKPKSMSDSIARDGNDPVAALAALLHSLAQQADGTRGRRRWDSLARLVSTPGGSDAGGEAAGAAELAALRQEHDDTGRSEALARVLRARAVGDEEFLSAFNHWRSQKQILAVERRVTESLHAAAARTAPAGPGQEANLKEDSGHRKSWRGRLSGPWTVAIGSGLTATILGGLVLTLILGNLGPGSSPSALSPPSSSSTAPVQSPSSATPAQSPSSVTPAQSNGISVAADKQFYRIFFPVRNASSSDQQLDQISVIMTYPTNIGCAEIQFYAYRLTNTIVVKKAGGIAQGAVTVESGHASGFAVPATGQWSGGCGPTQLYFEFPPPALTLNRLSTTMVAIDVPRRLNVISEIYPNKIGLQKRITFPKIGGTDFMAFHVRGSTSGGTKIDSCFVLRGALAAAPQGTVKCDATILGIDPFQKFRA